MISLTSTPHGEQSGSRHGRSRAVSANQPLIPLVQVDRPGAAARALAAILLAKLRGKGWGKGCSVDPNTVVDPLFGKPRGAAGGKPGSQSVTIALAGCAAWWDERSPAGSLA